MKKRIYKVEPINQVNISKLHDLVRGQRIAFGVDVAKTDFYAVFTDENRTVLKTIRWKSPTDNQRLLDLLKSLPVSALEIAMEPSGTYGDTFRHMVEQAGFSVYLVSPKKSRDACEIYDGVPSSHDAKSSAIIAHLHLDNVSKPWPQKSEKERIMAAHIEIMSLHDEQYSRNINRLESKLARYWPEFSTILKLGSSTLLQVIAEYGGPEFVALDSVEALKKIKKIGRSFLLPEKCEQIIESAQNSFGVPMLNSEQESLKKLAAEIIRNKKAASSEQKIIENLVEKTDGMQHMAAQIGKITTAVLYTTLGDPSNYHCAAAYQKAAGLNLKERSSGKFKGRLKITKRGSGTARRYLFLASLRLIVNDAICRAWYQKKVIRDGGKQKLAAVNALTRKLIKALWHVNKGEDFDATKLFDTKRLDLTL